MSNSNEQDVLSHVSNFISRNKIAILVALGGSLAVYAAYRTTQSQQTTYKPLSTATASSATPNGNPQEDDRRREAIMAKKLAKMSNRSLKTKSYSDPLEEFADLLCQLDARLNPTQFIEYLALLVRYYAGNLATFYFNQGVRNLTMFPGESECCLAALPARRVDGSNFLVLGEKFEFEKHLGFNLGDTSRMISHQAFIHMGEMEVARNDFRERICCIYSPAGGQANSQYGSAFAMPGHEDPNLIYSVTTKYGLNLNGDTRAPELQPIPILPRENTSQMIVALWRQGTDIVYALESGYPSAGSKQIVFKLHRLGAGLNGDGVQVDVSCEQIGEFVGPKSPYNEFLRFDGCWYNEDTGHLVGLWENGGEVMRFFDGRLHRDKDSEVKLSVFGWMEDVEAYFGATMGGQAYVVDVRFEDRPVEFRNTGTFKAHSAKLLFYHPETMVLLVINQFMKSSKYNYSMSMIPIGFLVGESN